MVGITSGVYSSEAIEPEENSERALTGIANRKFRFGLFSHYENLCGISSKSHLEHNLRLHRTIEIFVGSLDTKKLIKKCLISENPQGASKLALLSGNVMQAFEFTLQAYVKAGLVGADIFQAFIYFLHYPLKTEEQEVEVKRQLLERLIACWQDQKFSFLQLENLFIQVILLFFLKYLDNRLVFCCIVAWFQPDRKIFCCLKMKSVENILRYLRGQFSRFSRESI